MLWFGLFSLISGILIILYSKKMTNFQYRNFGKSNFPTPFKVSFGRSLLGGVMLALAGIGCIIKYFFPLFQLK